MAAEDVSPARLLELCRGEREELEQVEAWPEATWTRLCDAFPSGGPHPVNAASKCGHHNLVRMLLTHGFSINHQDEEGDLPLHHATKEGHVEIVRILLAQGADMTARNSRGSSALHKAAQYHQQEVLRVLLQHNPSAINATTEHGETALMIALSHSNLEGARLLLAQRPALDVQDEWGYTALHQACIRGNTALVQEMLDQHAPVNVANIPYGYTPLHEAADHGQADILGLLLAHGADCNAQTNDGRTAAYFCAQHVCFETLDLLFRRAPEPVDPNLATENGMTPLGIVIQNAVNSSVHELSAVITLLLDQGADVDLAYTTGQAPIQRCWYRMMSRQRWFSAGDFLAMVLMPMLQASRQLHFYMCSALGKSDLFRCACGDVQRRRIAVLVGAGWRHWPRYFDSAVLSDLNKRLASPLE